MGNIKARGTAYAGQYRYFGPKLNPDEQREILQSAKSGVCNADDTLQKHFERMIVPPVLRAIGKFDELKRGQEPHGYYKPLNKPEFDDVFQAARLRLLEVSRNFDPDRQNGLNAYARRAVAGAIHDEVMHWRLRGFTAGTAGSDRWSRADRWLYDNPWICERGVGWRRTTADDIVKSKGCTHESAERAIASRLGYRSGTDSYDTSEPYGGGDEPHAFAGDIGPFDQDPDIGDSIEPVCEPETRAQAQGRCLDEIDRAAIAADLWATRRLARIGRQKYADELVAQDREANPEAKSYQSRKPLAPEAQHIKTREDLDDIRRRWANGEHRRTIDEWRKIVRDEFDMSEQVRINSENVKRRIASLRRGLGNGETYVRNPQCGSLQPGRDLHRFD